MDWRKKNVLTYHVLMDLACEQIGTGVRQPHIKKWVRQPMDTLCTGVRQFPMEGLCVGVGQLQLEDVNWS